MKFHSSSVSSEEAMVIAKLSQCDWEFALGPSDPEADKLRRENDAELWADLTASPDQVVARYALAALEGKVADVVKVAEGTQRSLMAYTMKDRARAIKNDDPAFAQQLSNLAARINPEGK